MERGREERRKEGRRKHMDDIISKIVSVYHRKIKCQIERNGRKKE